MDQNDLITLTADIVSAHVANNSVAIGDLPTLVQNVHAALAGLGQDPSPEPERKSPVVSVRASVKPDFITCMECGKKQKILKRHLMTAHGMTPEQYRSDYGLAASYPMIAPNYSETRRGLAKAIGLGRKKEEEAQAPAQAQAQAQEGEEAKAPPRRRRAAKASEGKVPTARRSRKSPRQESEPV